MIHKMFERISKGQRRQRRCLDDYISRETQSSSFGQPGHAIMGMMGFVTTFLLRNFQKFRMFCAHMNEHRLAFSRKFGVNYINKGSMKWLFVQV